MRHCTRDLQAGRRDASATAAQRPAASMALHRRARQAVIPRRPGPKVHRLPRRQVTGSCCLLLGGASRDDLLLGSVANFTAGRRWRLHVTSPRGVQPASVRLLRKASAGSGKTAPVAAGGVSAACPAGACPHIGTFAPFAAAAEEKNGLLFLRALSHNCLPSCGSGPYDLTHASGVGSDHFYDV